MSYLADQRLLLVWKKISKHENTVLRTLASLNKCAVNLILSKYALYNINVSTTIALRNVCGTILLTVPLKVVKCVCFGHDVLSLFF